MDELHNSSTEATDSTGTVASVSTPKSQIKNKRISAIHSVVVPFFALLLIIGTLIYNDYVSSKKTREDIENRLLSSAIEQVRVLSATWSGQIESLEVVAIGLSKYDVIDNISTLSRLRLLENTSSFLHVGYALKDGLLNVNGRDAIDISERLYYQKAMQGESNFERVVRSEIDSGVRFVLTVPIEKSGEVIGVVVGSYSESLLAGRIIPQSSDDVSFTLICEDDGTIDLSIESEDISLPHGNFLRYLEDFTVGDKDFISQVATDIVTGKNGTFSYEVDGIPYFAVYLPLETYMANGNRLVLFNIIPYSHIEESSDALVRRDLYMFFVILLASGMAFVSYLHVLRNVNRNLARERNISRSIEEQNRVAVEESGVNLCRYDIATSRLFSYSKYLSEMGYAEIIDDVPEVFIRDGSVAAECIEDGLTFYRRIKEGQNAQSYLLLRVPDGSFHWFSMRASVVFDDMGKPYQAIILFKDVNEQREKDLAYARWQQAFDQRDPASYTLFRCNLSRGASYEEVSGDLLTIYFNPEIETFNGRTLEYARRFVHVDDYEAYCSLLDSGNLLSGYYRGVTVAGLDYRERVTEGEYRWLHVGVELAQYTDSSDICVVLLYEHANQDDIGQIMAKEILETDILTNTMSRRSFISQVTNLIANEQPKAQHALLLVDIDEFDLVNKNYGYTVGDQVLIEIADAIRAQLYEKDLLTRYDGDAFLVCMKDIPNDIIVKRKAAQIQAAIRKPFSMDVRLSASIGVAIYPKDGANFNALFHGVDLALHTARENGVDTYAFYNGETLYESQPKISMEEQPKLRTFAKKYMLLVDDDLERLDYLKKEFGDEYRIDVCSDEFALRKLLRLYVIYPSVILLSMDIDGLDGIAVLDMIHKLSGKKSVPVIAMGRIGAREEGLRALDYGATDFVLSPIDATLLRIRVETAIIKEENERLRTQNAFLQEQSSEGGEFRSLFEKTGTVVAEYDWNKHTFIYDPAFSEHVFGKYDERPLWQILMADMVADPQDVKRIQQLVADLANDRECNKCSMELLLKTPSKERHWFTMTAYKRVNDLSLTNKIILTFCDVNEDILATKKLQFQAEHDSLTGLYNHETFLRKMDELVHSKAANSFIVLCCNINDFRFFNERYGRDEGDRLLKYSAEKLRVYANMMEGFCGRISSDVYGLLIPYRQGTLERATNLVKHFFDDYSQKGRLTGRSGAYIITDLNLPAGDMLDLASMAADSIRNKYDEWLAVYDSSMNETRQKEKSIIARMESALANEEFVVYFQPQFNHASGQITGAEALVRWIDPQNGIITPANFIPIFEKNGFITRLDEYVWNITAKCMGEWLAQGNLLVPVSVNVSREDTNDAGLCQKLLAIINRHNVPAHMFRIEITESLFSEDTKHLVQLTNQLHEAGFLVEMDDFGSGYSSLNILKDVPVDFLKLDMRFFSGDDSLGRGGVIVNAVMRMARWLSMPVIAEGVELKEQADFLLSIGCPTIQGYYYEKPLPKADFEKRLLSNHTLISSGEDRVIRKNQNDSFWNPHSAESQTFNIFMGPAALFEFHDGTFEILRMNRRFIDMMQIDESTMQPTKDLFHFSDADKPRFLKAVLDAIYSDKDAELDALCLLGNGSYMTLHITVRLVAYSTNRAILLGEIRHANGES